MKDGHSGHHKESHMAHSEHHHHAGHKGAVVHVHAKKAGGKVMEDERTKEEVRDEMDGHKRGGHVEGKKARMRPDRRARGGRMTPKSPFSGADTGRASYVSKLSGNDMGGKGKEPRP